MQDADLVPQSSGPKSVQKLVKKMTPKITNQIAVLGRSKIPRPIDPSLVRHGASDAFWRGRGFGWRGWVFEGVWLERRGFGGLQTPPPSKPLHPAPPNASKMFPGPRWCQDAPQVSQDEPRDAIPPPSTQTSHGSNGVLPQSRAGGGMRLAIK